MSDLSPTLIVSEYTVNALPAEARIADWWVWNVRARLTRAGHWVVTDGHAFYDAAGKAHFMARDAGKHNRADAIDLAAKVAKSMRINGETAEQAATRIMNATRSTDADLSPAETLTAAAQELRRAATEATAGPWRTHDTHLNPGGHTAAVLTERDDLNETELVAWLPTWSHDPWTDGGNAWNNAAYAALVHPGVGLALADWFDSAAEDAKQIGPDYHALAVARLILGGVAE